jgi:hypothetical protein
MCGPSSSEKSLQQMSQSFSSLLQGNYSTLFGNQLDVLNSIKSSLSPILAAGPNQQGFSAAELAARNTAAINNAGAASRNAQQAVGNFTAGRGGGGGTGILSGVDAQLKTAVASSSANQLATAENQITQENYATGRENYFRAEGGMDQLAAGYSPNAASSGAIGANQASFGEAKTIQDQKMQEAQAIAGGITGIAGGLASGGFSQLAGGLSAGISAISPNADTGFLDLLAG